MLRQSAHMYKPRGEGWEVGERVKGKEGRDGTRWRGGRGAERGVTVVNITTRIRICCYTIEV